MNRHPADEGAEIIGAEPAEVVDGAALVEHILAEAEPLAITAETPTLAPQSAASASPDDRSRARIDGVVIGVVVGFTAAGAPIVDYPGNAALEPLEARSVVTLGDAHIAREVALLFESGDPRRPMVMGVVQQLAPIDVELTPVESEAAASPVEIKRDGYRVVIEAEQEIVLRCGQSRLTLARAGKVLMRWVY